jgi:hypothetical protein
LFRMPHTCPISMTLYTFGSLGSAFLLRSLSYGGQVGCPIFSH